MAAARPRRGDGDGGAGGHVVRHGRSSGSCRDGVGLLSGGEHQMLAVARPLAREPKHARTDTVVTPAG